MSETAILPIAEIWLPVFTFLLQILKKRKMAKLSPDMVLRSPVANSSILSFLCLWQKVHDTQPHETMLCMGWRTVLLQKAIHLMKIIRFTNMLKNTNFSTNFFYTFFSLGVAVWKNLQKYSETLQAFEQSSMSVSEKTLTFAIFPGSLWPFHYKSHECCFWIRHTYSLVLELKLHY